MQFIFELMYATIKETDVQCIQFTANAFMLLHLLNRFNSVSARMGEGNCQRKKLSMHVNGVESRLAMQMKVEVR